jgi:hypothetical protein
MQPRFGVTQPYWETMKAPHWPDFNWLITHHIDELDESYRDDVSKRHFHNPSYHPSMSQIARHRFNGIDKITTSYSQSMQDIFILTLLNGKTNGTYLELGAFDPVNWNNTYLLSQFGWTGVSIDIIKTLESTWKEKRPTSIFIGQDAFTIDYSALLEKYNFPKQIDFLQVDIDDVNANILLDSLLLLGYRFSVIMAEHDFFIPGNADEKLGLENVLNKHNYKRLVENVTCKDFGSDDHVPYEDWWIDVSQIDIAIQEKFLTVGLEKVWPFELFCLPNSVDHLMPRVLNQKNIWKQK